MYERKVCHLVRLQLGYTFFAPRFGGKQQKLHAGTELVHLLQSEPRGWGASCIEFGNDNLWFRC